MPKLNSLCFSDLNAVSAPYNTYPADLDAELAYIKASGITVKTVNQALGGS